MQRNKGVPAKRQNHNMKVCNKAKGHPYTICQRTGGSQNDHKGRGGYLK